MSELRLVCHDLPDFPGAFVIRLESNGKLLAVGKNAAQIAALRAVEEGLGHAGTRIVLRHASGKFTEAITVADAQAGKSPMRALTSGETAFIAALEGHIAELEDAAADAGTNRRGVAFINPAIARNIASSIRDLLSKLGLAGSKARQAA